MTTINYSYAANVAANQIGKNERLMDVAMTRLSTGKRINTGQDDPGAFSVHSQAIHEGKTARAAAQGVMNGIAYMQTVDAAAGQIESNLIRMKELAAQAANNAVAAEDRYALDNEFQNLGRDWIRIVADTKFNGTAVMGGTDLVVGVGGASTITLTVDNWGINAFTATTGNDVATGALVTGVTVSAGGATAGMLGFSTGDIAAAGLVPATGHENISTAANALLSFAKLTNMIKYVGESRGNLGAQINGLQSTYDNLSSQAIAYEQSASKIGDANYARETTMLAAHQILTQAATSILAQANARSSTVLTLLK
jgi:flagellin